MITCAPLPLVPPPRAKSRAGSRSILLHMASPSPDPSSVDQGKQRVFELAASRQRRHSNTQLVGTTTTTALHSTRYGFIQHRVLPDHRQWLLQEPVWPHPPPRYGSIFPGGFNRTLASSHITTVVQGTKSGAGAHGSFAWVDLMDTAEDPLPHHHPSSSPSRHSRTAKHNTVEYATLCGRSERRRRRKRNHGTNG